MGDWICVGGTAVGTVDVIDDGRDGADLSVLLNSWSTRDAVDVLARHVTLAATVAASPGAGAAPDAVRVVLRDADGAVLREIAVGADAARGPAVRSGDAARPGAVATLRVAAMGPVPAVSAGITAHAWIAMDTDAGDGARAAQGPRLTDPAAGRGISNALYVQRGGEDGDPIGPVHRVARIDPRNRRAPLALSCDDGSVLAIWAEAQDGSGSQDAMRMRRIGATGDAPGEVRRLDAPDSGLKSAPIARELTNGNTLVAWIAQDSRRGTDGIFARLVAPSGSVIGGQRVLATGAVDLDAFHSDPRIVPGLNGGFAMICRHGDALWYRPFDADGARDGAGAVQIARNARLAQVDVTTLACGRTAVAWCPSDGGLMVRILATTPAGVCDAATIVSAEAGGLCDPGVAPLPDGGLVVSYDRRQGDGSYATDCVQVGADGRPVSVEMPALAALQGHRPPNVPLPFRKVEARPPQGDARPRGGVCGPDVARTEDRAADRALIRRLLG